MPNRHTTDNNYRYAFQGQEKDGETGMEAFELRLWDGRIGRWLTIDPAGEFFSPYLGMGNNPINAVDPDGGDIIYLNDSKAVFGVGHAAVLIGNDKDGWRYLSMNGTGDGASPFGKNKRADLGNKRARKIKGRWIGNDFRGTGLTAEQVMKAVNTSNKDETHDYNRALRIRTSSFEDEIAYQAAKKQAANPNYNIFGCSCIDVPQKAFERVVAHRLNIESGKDPYFWSNDLSFFKSLSYGFGELYPNDWFFTLSNWDINNINNDLQNDFQFDDDLTPDYLKER